MFDFKCHVNMMLMSLLCEQATTCSLGSDELIWKVVVMPKQYPQEIRDDVIRVALNCDLGVTVAEVAHDIWVAPGTLERWSTRHHVETGEKPGLCSGILFWSCFRKFVATPW